MWFNLVARAFWLRQVGVFASKIALAGMVVAKLQIQALKPVHMEPIVMLMQKLCLLDALDVPNYCSLTPFEIINRCLRA